LKLFKIWVARETKLAVTPFSSIRMKIFVGCDNIPWIWWIQWEREKLQFAYLRMTLWAIQIKRETLGNRSYKTFSSLRFLIFAVILDHFNINEIFLYVTNTHVYLQKDGKFFVNKEKRFYRIGYRSHQVKHCGEGLTKVSRDIFRTKLHHKSHVFFVKWKMLRGCKGVLNTSSNYCKLVRSKRFVLCLFCLRSLTPDTSLASLLHNMGRVFSPE